MAFTVKDLKSVAADVNAALDDVMGEGKGHRYAAQSRNGYRAVDLMGKDYTGQWRSCLRTLQTGKPADCAREIHADAFWQLTDHMRSKRKRK
jgi:hypothetical protein